jgi:hypothetical protein
VAILTRLRQHRRGSRRRLPFVVGLACLAFAFGTGHAQDAAAPSAGTNLVAPATDQIDAGLPLAVDLNNRLTVAPGVRGLDLQALTGCGELMPATTTGEGGWTAPHPVSRPCSRDVPALVGKVRAAAAQRAPPPVAD